MKAETILTRDNGMHIKIIVILQVGTHRYVVTLKTKQPHKQTWISVYLPAEEDARNEYLSRYIDGNELYAAKMKMHRAMLPQYVSLRDVKPVQAH